MSYRYDLERALVAIDTLHDVAENHANIKSTFAHLIECLRDLTLIMIDDAEFKQARLAAIEAAKNKEVVNGTAA